MYIVLIPKVEIDSIETIFSLNVKRVMVGYR